MGRPMKDTPFVSFKVPFNHYLNRNRLISSDERFYLKDLFNQFPRLGLIIDLTKTTRYYDSQEVRQQNIQYHKIFMEGHGSIPPRHQVESFFEVVDKFKQQVRQTRSGNYLIGVHCTHGCNRTGYLICKYLVEKGGMEPRDALNLFTDSRGHAIERVAYINDIMATPPGIGLAMRQAKDGSVKEQVSTPSGLRRPRHSPNGNNMSTLMSSLSL